ncbi:methyl-accepting chemotaxis protein [Thalassotalea euphylliae]|uniref:Methyl-accepting chemotaxis protein n=2 Tax=Thalassotalea euphylliae TaxID=1655234 RepID=A0A3E0UI25_9GAMM|nr:methyl-accepting chemotaxis protein [Thalassotalea euphylliae]REL36658.1 methyl-accepting chemotaxis protein [Thalassotalea euphylliae]
MSNRPSVMRKVLLSVSSIISVIAIIVAFTVTSERATSVEASVLQNIRISTTQASDGIHEFFRERSRVVTSLQSNPFVNEWFANYTERGSDISDDKAYQQIVRLFKNESQSDPMIKSVFYAPKATHEYFDLNGRYNDPNYSTSVRPWWHEALSKDRLFITKPEIDANDKSIVTSIKTTVYDDNRALLGVMGIDILASEIRHSLIDTMKFQGLGYGFLFTADGQLISFPDSQNRIDMSSLPKLNVVDSQIEGAAGFADLMRLAEQKDEALTHVTWQGEDYLVYVASIKDDTLALDWRVGFMVPQYVIDEPVNHSIWTSSLAVIVIILVTAGVMMLTIQRLLTTPIQQIAKAMDDIATGEGDLTQRIEMNRNDELGQLSDSFNLFVENIQHIVKQSKTTTEKVLVESGDVSDLVDNFSSTMSEQKGYIEQIATATSQMTQTIHGISDNAQTALDHATQANSESAEGQQLAAKASQLMDELTHDVSNAANVVEELHHNSQSITAMLEVIKGIAEQTNLLALNAAIEAARAGEQGRGFAVVADEVRTLASRTQESTGEIEEIIAKLHASAASAVDAMHVGRDKTSQSADIITQVNDKLLQINQAIALIEQQSNETASATREQVLASDEITRQTSAVNDLAETTVSQTGNMASKSAEQRDITQQLNQMIAQFTV